MTFAEFMNISSSMKLTENGAAAYSELDNPLLTLFSQIGSMRNRSEFEIIRKMKEAYDMNSTLFLKMLFYAGDIRGGLGERRVFRIGLKWLAQNHPERVIANMKYIPEFNRWDSIFELIGTPVEKHMWNFVGKQYVDDMRAFLRKEPVSLLAKWMPSINTSSKKSRSIAKKFCKVFEITEKEYRRGLSTLRKVIRVVEKDMSANNWSQINYSAVPSYAMKNYHNAFSEHDADRFTTYLRNLENGKEKINASVLYPYDLVKKYLNRDSLEYPDEDPVIEAQWKNLPNYVVGENNYVVMADVSGSMCGRPMETSVGLAIYFAQHNKGEYHGKYMTFSSNPRFIQIDDESSLAQAVYDVSREGVGFSTNLEKAFRTILEGAIANRVSPADMPKALIVISDMEIDHYQYDGMDFVEEMKYEFATEGYVMPKLVMWQVESRNDTFLSKSPDVIFVSGQSTTTFKRLCGALDGKTAWDFMLETLMDNRYIDIL